MLYACASVIYYSTIQQVCIIMQAYAVLTVFVMVCIRRSLGTWQESVGQPDDFLIPRHATTWRAQ